MDRYCSYFPSNCHRAFHETATKICYICANISCLFCFDLYVFYLIKMFARQSDIMVQMGTVNKGTLHLMLAKYNAHTNPLFKQAAISNISDMPRINALTFYYKYKRRKLPNYFTTLISHHSYDTRSRDQIRTDRARVKFCDNRIRIFLPKLINSTPANLLQKIGTHSLQGF